MDNYDHLRPLSFVPASAEVQSTGELEKPVSGTDFTKCECDVVDVAVCICEQEVPRYPVAHQYSA